MSGGLNTEEDVTLGMLLLKLLHPLNQLLESGTGIREHTILTQFDPPKVYGASHMGIFGDICADHEGIFGNSGDSLILFLRLFILHDRVPPMLKLFFGRNVSQYTEGAFFIQTSD
ncbi:hypothetical protein D3C73_1124590 [compost metagenome]